MSIWTLAALLVIGTLLSLYFRRSAEDDFRELLQAHAYNLMGAVEVSEDGALQASPNLGDPRFLIPGSGWHWAVSRADDPLKIVLSSPSLVAVEMDTGEIEKPPFDDLFRRAYRYTDHNGQNIQHLEAQLYFGQLSDLYQVTIGANRDRLEEDIRFLNVMLIAFFSLYGLGTLISILIAVRLGLRPLVDATEELVSVRRGAAEKLAGDYPSEIQPFVTATNDLIAANNAVLTRARTQVGNLAHALKTPLAVILNESRKSGGEMATLISRQAESMQRQLDAYLSKARTAAQRQTVNARTDIVPLARQLVRTFGKLKPDIAIDLRTDEERVWFRGDGQDFQEILGNLLENACRHATESVLVSLESVREPSLFITLVVEDDGDGVPDDRIDQILQRGERLDESTPGSGLGLSIVHEIAKDYGGDVELSRSQEGGLKVSVYLPASGASQS